MKTLETKTGDPALEAEVARLAHKYGTWMHPSDLAIEEACSVDTARRRLSRGDYGQSVDQLPGGGLRILTATYLATLRARKLVFAGRSAPAA